MTKHSNDNKYLHYQRKIAKLSFDLKTTRLLLFLVVYYFMVCGVYSSWATPTMLLHYSVAGYILLALIVLMPFGYFIIKIEDIRKNYQKLENKYNK